MTLQVALHAGLGLGAEHEHDAAFRVEGEAVVLDGEAPSAPKAPRNASSISITGADTPSSFPREAPG